MVMGVTHSGECRRLGPRSSTKAGNARAKDGEAYERLAQHHVMKITTPYEAAEKAAGETPSTKVFLRRDESSSGDEPRAIALDIAL
jgi:hypothetical protein